MNSSINTYNLQHQPSPHISSNKKSQMIMLHVLIALCFPAVAAVYFFGFRAMLMIAVGMFTSVLFEYLYQLIRKKTVTVNDGSAAVTGMLLGLSLPTTAPIWTLVLGTGFAIVVVKQLSGGIGRNLFNPAVSARVMLKIFFTPWITNWVLPGHDAISTATPLEHIGHFARSVPAEIPSLMDLFLGIDLGGNAGETSKLMIFVGMIYLIVAKVITPKIPVIYISTVAFIMLVYSGFDLHFMGAHALSGTLFFAAVFMATDYSSGALTPKGQIFFALGCGVLTSLFRIVFNFPGGVGFSIIIMNMLAPWIDKQCTPRIYGHKKAIKVRGDREM